MKSLMLAAIGLATIAVPATAQRWQPIDQRQQNLERRIDQGVRSGALNRAEAGRLRIQYRDLSRLEYRYRQNGLTRAERRDLDRRFDALSSRIRVQKNDRQHRR